MSYKTILEDRIKNLEQRVTMLESTISAAIIHSRKPNASKAKETVKEDNDGKNTTESKKV